MPTPSYEQGHNCCIHLHILGSFLLGHDISEALDESCQQRFEKENKKDFPSKKRRCIKFLRMKYDCIKALL